MTTYNERLAENYTVIRAKVKGGMLPLVARNPAIDKAVSEYAVAHADYYVNAIGNGKNPPINYKDSDALDKYADLVMYEELTWSHPDKMSIVEYPVMSDRQAEERESKFFPKSDLQFGDLRHLGKRRVGVIEDDIPSEGKRRVIEPADPVIEATTDVIDLYNALDNAGLTARQRQAIDLVYFSDMTQEDAAQAMGISQQAVAKFERVALAKLRKNMTEV